jgi:hypothetical protein
VLIEHVMGDRIWQRSKGSSLCALWSVTRSVPRRTSSSPAASRLTSFQKQYPEYLHHPGEIVTLEPVTKSAGAIHRSLRVRNESEFVQCQGIMIPAPKSASSPYQSQRTRTSGAAFVSLVPHCLDGASKSRKPVHSHPA